MTSQALLFPDLPLNEYSFARVVYRPYFQIFGELLLDSVEEDAGCVGDLPFTSCSRRVCISQATQFVRMCVYVCMCVCVCACVRACVCVHVCTYPARRWRAVKCFPPPQPVLWMCCVMRLCAAGVVDCSSLICSLPPHHQHSPRQPPHWCVSISVFV